MLSFDWSIAELLVPNSLVKNKATPSQLLEVLVLKQTLTKPFRKQAVTDLLIWLALQS